MKEPKLSSIVGFSVNRNHRNKCALNIRDSDHRGCSNTSLSQDCGCRYGGKIARDHSSLVTSLCPVMVGDNLSNMRGNFEQSNKLNLKYFSAPKNSSIEPPRGHVLEYGNEDKNLINYDPASCNEAGNESLLQEYAINVENANGCQCHANVNRNRTDSWTKGRQIRNYEEQTNHILFESLDETECQHKNNHELLNVPWKILPCNKCFAKSRKYESDKKITCDECYLQSGDELYDLVNSPKFDATGSGSYYEPYVVIPKHTFCIKQKRQRRDSAETPDVYIKTPLVDASVETSEINLLDLLKDSTEFNNLEELYKKLRNHGFNWSALVEEHEMDQKPDESVKEEKRKTVKVAMQQTGKDAAEDMLLQESIETSESPVLTFNEQPLIEEPKSQIEGSSETPKKGPIVQEIKYYEGSLNIFGMQDGKDVQSEYPYFKITKTVTFEKDKGREGKSSDKALGIDSWIQTDMDYNESENGSATSDENKSSSRRETASVPTTSNDPFFECAKVCCDCLKNIASNKFQGQQIVAGSRITVPKMNLPITRKPDIGEKIDKSTSIEKGTPNIVGAYGADFMKFIAELFLEVLPRELYNKMMGESEKHTGRDEEFEVRVKSYDKGSSESCTLKTCRMRNSGSKLDSGSSKGQNQKIRIDPLKKPPCSCSDYLLENNASPSKPVHFLQDKRDIQNQTLNEEESAYDCQITLNGRKISVKVNKSVEDLLLSGNVHNVLRVPSNERLPNKSVKGKQFYPQNENSTEQRRIVGNCSCSEDMFNKQSGPTKTPRIDQMKGKVNIPEKNYTTQSARRGSSVTAIEIGKYEKKPGNEQVGGNQKPVISSPPMMNPLKNNKTGGSEKKTGFSNLRNLYWCNVDVPKKMSDVEDQGRFLKDKLEDLKKNGKNKDLDPNRNLMRHPDNRPTVFNGKTHTNSRGHDTADEKNKSKKREKGNIKDNNNYIPLYWESEYMKFSDRVSSKDRESLQKVNKCGNYESQDVRNRNFVHEVEKRLVVTPSSYRQCRDINNTPLCFIKIGNNDKYQRSNGNRYHDFTVASLASVKLNSNPFDSNAITCRKCIETLKSCALDANWNKSDGCNPLRDTKHPLDFCGYYWNQLPKDKDAELDYAKLMKISSETSAGINNTSKNIVYDNVFPVISQTDINSNLSSDCDSLYRFRPNFCCLNDSYYATSNNGELPSYHSCKGNSSAGSDYAINSDVLPHKLYGICFDITRVKTSQGTTCKELDPPLKSYSHCKTTNKNNVEITTAEQLITAGINVKVDKKTSFTGIQSEKDENKVGKPRSIVSFALFGGGSKTNIKEEKFSKKTGESLSTQEITQNLSKTSNDDKFRSVEVIKSADKIVSVNNMLPQFPEPLELHGGENVEKRGPTKKKFRFRRWKWWRRKGKIDD